MTVKNISPSIIRYAESCMSVLKDEFKTKKLAPSVVANKLSTGELSIRPVFLSAAYYSMQYLKDRMKEAGVSPARLSREYGVDADEVKGWLRNGTMPYRWFMELCRLTHTKMSEVASAAKEMMAQDKQSGYKSVPTPVLPDGKIIAGWFRDATLPYVFFLAFCKFAGTNAHTLVEEGKRLAREKKESGTTGGNAHVVGGTVKVEGTPVATPPEQSEQDKVDEELGRTPWSQTLVDSQASVDEPSSLPADPWVGVDGNALLEKDKANGNGSDGVLEGWDGTVDAGSSDDDSDTPVSMDGDGTGGQSAGGAVPDATGKDSDDGKAVSPPAEPPHGSMLDDVDMSTPQSQPYDFYLDGKDSNMDGASAVIMNWQYLKTEALKAHDGLTDERRRKMADAYPTPVKVNNSVIGLRFGSDTQMRKFVDKGYMNDLQEVIDRHGDNVTVQQANFTEQQQE